MLFSDVFHYNQSIILSLCYHQLIYLIKLTLGKAASWLPQNFGIYTAVMLRQQGCGIFVSHQEPASGGQLCIHCRLLQTFQLK